MNSEFMDIPGRPPLRAGHWQSPRERILSGKPMSQFGELGSLPGEFNTPEAAKFDSDGKLYAADLRNDRIQVFDAEGRPLTSFGKSGNGVGELKSPAGLAFDRDDNLYVTEIGNNRVQVFDKSGVSIAMWGKKGSDVGEFGNLHGIIVDKVTGQVYVADTANNRIQVFRPIRPASTTGAGASTQ